MLSSRGSKQPAPWSVSFHHNPDQRSCPLLLGAAKAPRTRAIGNNEGSTLGWVGARGVWPGLDDGETPQRSGWSNNLLHTRFLIGCDTNVAISQWNHKSLSYQDSFSGLKTNEQYPYPQTTQRFHDWFWIYHSVRFASQMESEFRSCLPGKGEVNRAACHVCVTVAYIKASLSLPSDWRWVLFRMVLFVLVTKMANTGNN